VRVCLRQADKRVSVIVLRRDGKVGSRSVGEPAWPKLVEELSKIPKTDIAGNPVRL